MPDPNNNDQNQNSTTNPPQGIPPSGQDDMDVPPMVVPSTPEPIVAEQAQPQETMEKPEENQTESGSAFPVQAQDDTTVVSPSPKKKFGGGKIIATGTPREIMANPLSFTGQYLKKEFEK